METRQLTKAQRRLIVNSYENEFLMSCRRPNADCAVAARSRGHYESGTLPFQNWRATRPTNNIRKVFLIGDQRIALWWKCGEVRTGRHHIQALERGLDLGEESNVRRLAEQSPYAVVCDGGLRGPG